MCLMLKISILKETCDEHLIETSWVRIMVLLIMFWSDFGNAWIEYRVLTPWFFTNRICDIRDVFIFIHLCVIIYLNLCT